MNRPLPPLAAQVLEHLGARTRLGETEFSISTRYTSALKLLGDLGLVEFRTGVVEGTWLAMLTSTGWDEVISPNYVPPVALLHERSWNGSCTSCTNEAFPCRTRRILMPTEGQNPDATSITPDGPDHVVVSSEDGSMRIHREDADPEDRRYQYRLAAAWFGNAPAPKESW